MATAETFRTVPRSQPETVWAIRGVPEEVRETFYCSEHVERGAVFLPLRTRDRILDWVRNHFIEYPGALTLVGMTREQERAALEFELRPKSIGKPQDRTVLFSWLRLPGVIE
jgi:hypothetical protein